MPFSPAFATGAHYTDAYLKDFKTELAKIGDWIC